MLEQSILSIKIKPLYIIRWLGVALVSGCMVAVCDIFRYGEDVLDYGATNLPLSEGNPEFYESEHTLNEKGC